MKPLEGIRVIDLSSFYAAPTVPRVLGEWGAEVIKIEPPFGDPARTQGGVFNVPYSDDENPAFDMANFNKKFVSINLKSEEGKEAAYRLIDSADVLITNYRTKALEKLGFSYEELSARHPKLVFAQILGYGEKGPEKDTPGYDVTAYLCRSGGLVSMCEKGESPLIEPNAYGDFQASMCLAGGICAALVGRNETGKGDKVTVSLHHTGVFMLNTAVLTSQYPGNEWPRSRKAVVNPFNNTYKSKDDRWFLICAPEYNRYYPKVMKLIGREDLIDREEFKTVEKLNELGKNREIIEHIENALVKFTLDEVMKLFKENDIPIEKGYIMPEVLEDEQAWANDILRKVEYPTGLEVALPTNPVRFKTIGNPELRISKPLGYHTDEILSEVGYSKEEIDVMKEKEAIK